MISCLLLEPVSIDAANVARDFEAVGIRVLGAALRNNLVHEAARLGPDLVVVLQANLDDDMFDMLTLLRTTAPRPVLMFTSDPDVDRMKRAVDAGVHEYVVNGYARERLRSLVHVAQVRFAHEQQLREQVAELSRRFEERKLVDRAKGILMRARQVSEDEAFRVLRTASMHSNLRIGQVSQQVIAAASLAEAVNRAGQLRMLSQRIVKLYALQALQGLDTAQPVLQDALSRVDRNLAVLGRSLSRATYGDLLDAVGAPWAPLKALLAESVEHSRLVEVDTLAEELLLRADRLVSALESSGAGGRLHVINVAGRQRMLSQRLAKPAVLAVPLSGEAAEAADSEAEKSRVAFEEALVYLQAAPLTTQEIRDSLDEAVRTWGAMTRALTSVRTTDGQKALGDSSEALLASFERLTERYEHSVQILMG